jgi:hypothetical protein
VKSHHKGEEVTTEAALYSVPPRLTQNMASGGADNVPFPQKDVKRLQADNRQLTR